MSNVLNKTTLEYRESVNTPDFSPTEWLINPDMSTVKDVPKKYMKVSGASVLEMTALEKANVDALKPPVKADPLIALKVTLDSGKADLADVRLALSTLLSRFGY